MESEASDRILKVMLISTGNEDVECEAKTSDLVHEVVEIAFKLGKHSNAAETTERILQGILFGSDEVSPDATFADYGIEVV